MPKSSKRLANWLKREVTIILLIIFNDVLIDVRPYTVTVSYCSSTSIGYQKWFIRFMTKITLKFIWPPLLVLVNTQLQNKIQLFIYYTPTPRRGRGVYYFTSVRQSICPSILSSVQDIFRRIFLSNCWRQKSDIWSQASYRYTILWVAFLDPSDSYFLFADLVGFYTHWTYMLIFRYIFLSNYWWQKSDIWSQASYRYPISWEAFLDPSDSYFLFANFVDFYTHLTYICICTFFVAFFSATIDDRNLIFGHKLHIGMPYCGKRFWTHQIPTSCLPT